jgi:hypothetical protein
MKQLQKQELLLSNIGVLSKCFIIHLSIDPVLILLSPCLNKKVLQNAKAFGD